MIVECWSLSRASQEFGSVSLDLSFAGHKAAADVCRESQLPGAPSELCNKLLQLPEVTNEARPETIAMIRQGDLHSELMPDAGDRLEEDLCAVPSLGVDAAGLQATSEASCYGPEKLCSDVPEPAQATIEVPPAEQATKQKGLRKALKRKAQSPAELDAVGLRLLDAWDFFEERSHERLNYSE